VFSFSYSIIQNLLGLT